MFGFIPFFYEYIYSYVKKKKKKTCTQNTVKQNVFRYFNTSPTIAAIAQISRNRSAESSIVYIPYYFLSRFIYIILIVCTYVPTNQNWIPQIIDLNLDFSMLFLSFTYLNIYTYRYIIYIHCAVEYRKKEGSSDTFNWFIPIFLITGLVFFFS